MDCLDRDRLLALLDGDPTAAEADHVERCAHCQRTLAELTPAEDALGQEVRQAAREPAYAEIEVDRAVALVAGLERPAAAVDFSTQLPATPSTANQGDPSLPTQSAAPPAPDIPLPFLSPPRGPGELGWLGEYRVLTVLGHGGMGVVLRAEEAQLERQVAIKVMLPELAADKVARERFLREAWTMARVEHRHVIPIYRVEEANGIVYLVMKLLQGESLEQRLRRERRLDLADAVRAARETAEGLAAAHARGLVHRDVKPANLWLETTSDGGWQLLLLDFGLARPGPGDAQAVTRFGMVVGTPAYMAPEQAEGGDLDGRCDLFSLGCVLYRMTTGKSPFAAPDVISTLRKVALEDPPPPRWLCPEVPPALSELVMRLLAKKREDRPISATAVMAGLREIERALPDQFRAPGPAEVPAPGRQVDNPVQEAPPVTPVHMPGGSGAQRSMRARRGWHRSGRRWILAGSSAAALAVLVVAGLGFLRPLVDIPETIYPLSNSSLSEQKSAAVVKTFKYLPKIDDNPRNVPAPPKLVELPPGPAPAAMAPETTRKVMKATVMVKAMLPGGGLSQGSGFFAAEPGLVFTNAHVLDMMAASDQKPTKVEVIINSGQGNDEFVLIAKIEGVDRHSNLAVLRVDGDAGRWPAPLPVDSSQALIALQNLYVFGFPHGNELGKEISVNESKVSSVRRDRNGNVKVVQVSGGISSGNSGGPVVDSRGVVVAVAVGIMKGTPIAFAVPGDKVLGMLRGQVTEMEFGEPYRDRGAVRLPIHLQCMDYLQRIKSIKAEVWKGKPGPARPAAVKAPSPQPGDGTRAVVALIYDGTKAVGECDLPAVDGTEVIWMQPVLTDGSGATSWARAIAFTPLAHPPLERKTVVLQQRYDTQRERSVKLNSALKMEAMAGGVQQEVSKTVQVEALELAETDPRGGRCNVTIGTCAHSEEMNGQAMPGNAQVPALLRGKAFGFITSAQGAIVERSNPRVPVVNNPLVRLEYDQLVGQIGGSYELICLSMPNRQMRPGESWEIRLPFALGAMIGLPPMNVITTCTFEGTRLYQGEEQALIRLSGVVRGPGGGNMAAGKVTGMVHFAVTKGYVSQAAMRVEFTAKINGGGAATLALEVNLSRVAGKGLGLTPAVVVTRGRGILQITSALTRGDRRDYPNKAGCFYKTFPVELTAGKTYIIAMNRASAGPPMLGSFDPYLVLHDPTGRKVAEDDDSGGSLNALVTFQAPTTGTYQIYATTFQAGLVGRFQLKVYEGVSSR